MDNLNTNRLPLISVVIPSYNRASTILECVNSILKQTYSNIEIIIVDDCSTDNTDEIVKQLTDKRVRYYKLEKNMRACFARNFGADHALGEYIAFQDSDDIWHNEKLFEEYQALTQNEVDFVFCGMNKIDVNGNRVGYFPEAKISSRTDYYKQELKLNVVSTQTILMKKEVIQHVRFDEALRKYQDWDFAIRVSKNYKMLYLPKALVDYRLQTNSVSLTVNHFEAYMRIYEKYKMEIQKFPEINAFYYSGFGDCFRDSDYKKAISYYSESLNRHFNPKTFIKLVLTKARSIVSRKG